MMHGLDNNYLYAAKQFKVEWIKDKNITTLSGTGFFVGNETDTYFITNRHLIDPEYFDVKYRGYNLVKMSIQNYEAVDGDGLQTQLEEKCLENFNEFIFHTNYCNDVACIKNPKFTGGIKIYSAIPLSLLASEEWINEKLIVCDTIAYPGFPDGYDRKNKTPIFRMGTIASDPRLNYSWKETESKGDCIAYEGFSTKGASGSPVFAVQKGFKVTGSLSASDGFYREVKVIGVNAGHLFGKDGHSGISYLYKSATILDMIESF